MWVCQPKVNYGPEGGIPWIFCLRRLWTWLWHTKEQLGPKKGNTLHCLSIFEAFVDMGVLYKGLYASLRGESLAIYIYV